MRRGIALALGVVAVATPVALWPVLFPARPDDPAAGGARLRVERLPRVAGVGGAARATSVAGDVLAACFDDGSLVVRRGGVVARVPPPEPGEELRRAAAFPDGRVIAISQRGRLYEVRLGQATALSLRAQAGSRLVAQPGSDAVFVAGEAGLLRRLDLATKTFADVGEGGEPPTGALAATASVAVVGRVDGVVRVGAVGGSLTDALRLSGDVSAVDAVGPWVAAGSAEGEVRSKRAKTSPSGATAKVAGRVVALALPRGGESAGGHDPLLVLHEPATVTLFSSGSYERTLSLELTGKALCGAPLSDAQGLYVGLENGEEVVVRVEPSR